MEKSEKVKIFRSRFYGRQELYGRFWTSTKEDGSVLKGYAPCCERFWTNGCHIKLKDGVTCARCEIKQYEPVSDESVWRHISGEEPQIQYLVQDDGTIRFAAVDYDCKPGKEAQGYTFEDVKVVSKLLTEEGIPHHIARSTSAGYHLYFFISAPFAAAKFRTLSFWMFERAGFIEQMRQGIRPLPEFFPKQSYTGGFGPGNGIKPPMIEPQIAKGRNCFVDENDSVINDQWGYLQNAAHVTPEQLDALIEKYDLEVDDSPLGQGNLPGQHSSRRRTSSGSSRTYAGRWQQPLTGSYEKVIEGCSAVRKVYDKAAAGTTPSHNEGFSAYHLAMSTADGLEIFRSRMTGWGTTDKDLQQLEHSIGKEYAPWTCKKMQENGVCVPGTKCFDRKPPIDLIEGRYVVRTDVPEDQWPDPSPIRYAFSKGDDFLDKLKKEVDNLPGEQDDVKRGNLLRDIARRAQVFDEDQQRSLKEYIRSKKLMRAPELNKVFNKAETEKAKETREKAATRVDSVVVDDNTYQLLQPFGYTIVRKVKDELVRQVISNCSIELEEERSYLDDDTIIKTVYAGTFRALGIERKFEIDVKQWVDNGEFMSYFHQLAGSAFTVLRTNADIVKQAAQAFANKNGFKRTNKLVTQGWYQGTFLMPGVQIDKDGVRPNTEKEIDLQGKPHSSFLQFKMFGEDDLRTTLFHVKTEFLNTWPRKWTMFGLSHAMMPALLEPLGIRKKPVMFYEGLTGTGKTELCHHLQYFWGEFESLVNLASTSKSLRAISHEFKDCLLVLDDYKGLDNNQIKALQECVQYSYDPNSRMALRSDSTFQKPKAARATMIFTGESFISNDAAMIARTTLIETQKQDTTFTAELYGKCIDMRKNYSGVTPCFIHWFLHQDANIINARIKFLKGEFQKNGGVTQNIDRIAWNLSLNCVVWEMFTRFMVDVGVCTMSEQEALVKEHSVYALEILHEMVSRCKEEQNVFVFMRTISQLIIADSVVVDGINSGQEDSKHKALVGFVGMTTEGEKILNLFVDVSFPIVCRHLQQETFRITKREVGRQLNDAGLLYDPGKERFQKQIRYKNSTTYVWPIRMKAVGLLDGELTVVQGGKSDDNSSKNDSKLPPYHKAVSTPNRPI